MLVGLDYSHSVSVFLQTLDSGEELVKIPRESEPPFRGKVSHPEGA